MQAYYDEEEAAAKRFHRRQCQTTFAIMAMLIVIDVVSMGLLPFFFLRHSTHGAVWMVVILIAWCLAFTFDITLKIVIFERVTPVLVQIIGGIASFGLMFVVDGYAKWLPALVIAALVFAASAQILTVLAMRNMYYHYKTM